MSLSITSVVIDTSIFLHAQNEGVDCCDASKEFLKDVQSAEIRIYVDEDDLIMHEYTKKLSTGTPGGAGKEAFAKFIRSGRFDPIPLRIESREKRIIHQHILKRKKRDINYNRDRTFAIIAYNSDSCLVTNDFEHFTIRTRGELYKLLSLTIYCAGGFYTFPSCVGCRKG